MNSILLCEGSNDFVLLQYFMRNVYNWEDKEIGPKFLQPTRILTKDGRKLVIGGTGGSSQIIPKLNKIIEGNHLSSLETEYSVSYTHLDVYKRQEYFRKQSWQSRKACFWHGLT